MTTVSSDRVLGEAKLRKLRSQFQTGILMESVEKHEVCWTRKKKKTSHICIFQINIFHHFQYEEDDLPLGSVCPLARVRVCSGWYEELNNFAPVLLPSSQHTITLVLSFRLVTTIIPS